MSASEPPQKPFRDETGFGHNVPQQHALHFQHIQTIYAVILAGSVTGAAERLSLTQPALSNRLRDAQERIGFDLFERRAGRLVPTEDAMLLFEEIERSFIGLGQINSLCARIRQQRRKRMSIVCTPVFGAVVLPHVIAAYSKLDPDVYFSIESRPAQYVAAQVHSRKADIGFALEVPATPGLASEVLGQLPLMCYLPAAHPLARAGATIHARDLINEPMISLSRNEGVEQIIARAFQDCGGFPTVTAECPAALSACAMVAANVGFTIFDALPAAMLHPGAVSVHPFEPAATLTYRAYWSETRTLPESLRAMIDLAQQAIASASDHAKRDNR
jgi:DNA-binding transcriptional LysR family regulator